jgi:hypothetical protein
VLQVFTRRPGRQQLGWLGVAIFYHALMDASVVFIAGMWGGYAAEAVLGGMAILDIVIILALRQPEPESSALPTSNSTNVPPVFIQTPIDETSENLEKTRYQ